MRALLAYMWAHPGKKLLFMGCEFGQFSEWSHSRSLDWHLTQWADHWRLQDLMKDLNRLYKSLPQLFEADVEPAGFQWIDASNADDNVVAFMRTAPASGKRLICICNFSPVIRPGYRVGLPRDGYYPEILNTDSSHYGGSNFGNGGGVHAQAHPWHGLSHSAVIELPPLSAIWLEVPQD